MNNVSNFICNGKHYLSSYVIKFSQLHGLIYSAILARASVNSTEDILKCLSDVNSS